ncbi:MAG: DNRLRE domain-containing protein [Oligoflexales bacterium]
MTILKAWMTWILLFAVSSCGKVSFMGQDGTRSEEHDVGLLNTLAFTPIADATLNPDSPTKNYGATTDLDVDGSPRRDFLIKFNVTGVGTSAIQSVRLIMRVSDSSSKGGNISSTATNWTESSVTWNNAPAAGILLFSANSVSSGNSATFDITRAVTGDGEYSFRFSSTSSDGAEYRSKESTTKPRLEIVVDTGVTNPPPPPPSGGELVFSPVADARLDSGSPSTNRGSLTTFTVDSSPRTDSILRFNVTGVGAATVSKALLDLRVTDSSSNGGQFFQTTSSWAENTVTWNNAPAKGTQIATRGSVSSGSVISVDLSSYIKGDGTYSIRMSSTSSDAASYSSKEGSVPPKLRLTVSQPVLSVNAGPDKSVIVNQPFSSTGSLTNPDDAQLALVVDYGDGTTESPVINSNNTFALQHVYTATGTYTVTASLNDGAETVTDTAVVTVATPSSAKYCVVGDTGTAGTAQMNVSKAMLAEGCSAFLMTGDIIYSSGLSSTSDSQFTTKFKTPYQAFFNKAGFVFYMSLGNHDHDGNESVWLSLANQFPGKIFYPNYYYAVDFPGDVCLFSMDSNFRFTEQQSWRVTEKAKHPNCKFSIAMAHHPYRSSGEHGNASGSLKTFLDNAIVGKFDLYLAGHDHDLEDSGVVSGTRLLVSGGGGRDLRDVGSNYVWSKEAFGYLVLTFSGNQANYVFKSVSGSTVVTEHSGTVSGVGLR